MIRDMARIFTTPFNTETQKKTGARPRVLLSLELASGLKWYSTQTLTTAGGDPVDTDGLIVSLGELAIDAQPGKSGGMGNIRLVLADPVRELMNDNTAQPGLQSREAQLYLWYEGTTWPDDRMLLFDGSLTTPMTWDEATAQTTLSMRGMEHFRDPSIGIRAKQRASDLRVRGQVPSAWGKSAPHIRLSRPMSWRIAASWEFMKLAAT